MTIHSTFVNSVTTAHVLALKLLFGVDMCVTFLSNTRSKNSIKFDFVGGAAIAQWIRLRQPSCRPRFESQAHHLCFFIYSICALFVM